MSMLVWPYALGMHPGCPAATLRLLCTSHCAALHVLPCGCAQVIAALFSVDVKLFGDDFIDPALKVCGYLHAWHGAQQYMPSGRSSLPHGEFARPLLRKACMQIPQVRAFEIQYGHVHGVYVIAEAAAPAMHGRQMACPSRPHTVRDQPAERRPLPRPPGGRLASAVALQHLGERAGKQRGSWPQWALLLRMQPFCVCAHRSLACVQMLRQGPQGEAHLPLLPAHVLPLSHLSRRSCLRRACLAA